MQRAHRDAEPLKQQGAAFRVYWQERNSPTVPQKPTSRAASSILLRQIGFLPVCERVDLLAHKRQLHRRHAAVDLGRDGDELFGQLSLVLREIARAQRLDGEAHVHNFRRMAVSRGEIDQPSLGQQVEPVAVGHFIAADVLAHFLFLHGDALERLHVHLDVEMPRVGQQRTVLHHGEVALGDDLLSSR